MKSFNRRKFIEQLSLAAAAGILSDNLEAAWPQQASGPHTSFPTEPRERIAIASYPFRAYIESPANHDRDRKLPGMDLIAFPSHIVEKFGVHNIEPHSRHFASTEATYLAKFRDSLGQAKVKVVDLAAAADGSFYDADASARARAVAFAKKWVDVAKQIDSPSVRTHVVRAANSSPNVERAAESFRQVVDYAASQNIIITLENDDSVSEDPFFLVKVMDAVNSPYLRGLPDFANSLLSIGEELNYRALQAMFQHAYSICHIKDGETDDKGKHFTVDLKKCFDILKGSNYHGYCSMEYDAPGDPYPATAKLIEQTIQYLS